MDYSESVRSSKINAAGIINDRVQALWSRANTASIQGNFLMWNAFLDSLWQEFAADAQQNKKDEDSDETTFDKIQKKLVKSNFFSINEEKEGFHVLSKTDLEKKREHRQILSEKHIFLKKLEKKQGRGGAYKDEYEETM